MKDERTNQGRHIQKGKSKPWKALGVVLFCVVFLTIGVLLGVWTYG